ncbi:MAG: hypothetical protein IPI79_00435 [Moraxellaceae bacterium]|nr:hypothetical protein [Moraxellaceae bacterium]
MKFKLGITTALLTGLLAACGGDGNGAGTDAKIRLINYPLPMLTFLMSYKAIPPRLMY